MAQGIPIHSKLLTAAARQILRPMGLAQKGRSRTWLDDHVWWLCVVEFQPSGWSSGTYLNVGCNWLWQVKGHLSFDEGYRVEGFSNFHAEHQFECVAEQLARRAAGEVERYRKLFPNVRAVADHYLRNPPNGFWPNFNAAVACGLAPNSDAAHRLFGNVMNSRDDRDWALAAKSDAEQLDRMVDDVQQFRETVAARVRRTRELQKLPNLAMEWG